MKKEEEMNRRGLVRDSMRGKLLIEILFEALMGLGIIILFSPLALYWFIHGDEERYEWIINGPEPFSSFGSGPYQMMMYIVLLMGGIVLMATIYGVRRKLRAKQK